MISTFIRNACGAVWNIVLLSTVDALDLLPSYEEVNNVLYCYKCWYRNGKACSNRPRTTAQVFELFSDVGLEQLGLLSVIMQHPLVRIAMGRLLVSSCSQSITVGCCCFRAQPLPSKRDGAKHRVECAGGAQEFRQRGV